MATGSFVGFHEHGEKERGRYLGLLKVETCKSSGLAGEGVPTTPYFKQQFQQFHV